VRLPCALGAQKNLDNRLNSVIIIKPHIAGW
jgi:hypothetical protein